MIACGPKAGRYRSSALHNFHAVRGCRGRATSVEHPKAGCAGRRRQFGTCLNPWRSRSCRAQPATRSGSSVGIPAMARPGLEPGTPRFSAVVSSRRPGRAASQRPLPFARRSTLPTPRSPPPSPRRARPARPRGRRRRGSRRATPPSEYRAAWQIRRWGAARYVVLQMFAARRRPTVDASVPSSSERGLS